MDRRPRMCSGCPFNPERTHPPIDDEAMQAVRDRIAGGEEWVCHQTCERRLIVTDRSMLCAGAPASVGGRQ